MRSTKDVLSTQVGNIKMAAMLEEKGLKAHPDKTCFIVCGNKSYKEKVQTDLQRNPIMFGNFPVVEKEGDRYLGQVLHGGGLATSAEATVLERTGRIKGATREIKTIIEEYQMQAIGGMMAAWELWERALIPSLLSGAGTWFGMKSNKNAVELCDSLQKYFCRVRLTVPESCPKIYLQCATWMLGMQWRIWLQQLMLVLKIRRHPHYHG